MFVEWWLGVSTGWKEPTEGVKSLGPRGSANAFTGSQVSSGLSGTGTGGRSRIASPTVNGSKVIGSREGLGEK